MAGQVTAGKPASTGSMKFARIYRPLLPFFSLAVVLLVFLLADLLTNGGVKKFGAMSCSPF